MASDDVNIDAGQSFKSENIENSEYAKKIAGSDDSDGISNTTIDSKKSCAALISELDTLVNTVQEGGGKAAVSASEPTNATSNLGDQDQSQDLENTTSHGSTPVGLAILQADKKFQDSGNKMIESLASMTSELTELTTQVTADGANWSKDFYDYGLPADQTTVGSAIGQWKIGTPIPAGITNVSMQISNGTYYMSVDGGKMTPLDGAVQTDGIGNVQLPTQYQISQVFPYLTLPDSETNANNQTIASHSGGGSTGDGATFAIPLYGAARTTGGSGIANASTSEMQNMLSQDSVILSTINARDTASQNTTSSTIPLESAIVGSIDNNYSNANTTLQMVSSVLNLINKFNN